MTNRFVELGLKGVWLIYQFQLLIWARKWQYDNKTGGGSIQFLETIRAAGYNSLKDNSAKNS